MGVTDNFRSGSLRQGAPMGATNQYFLLTADGTVLDPTGLSMMFVGSNNTTATNRTFTLLPSPLVGHELTLQFYTGSSTTAELVDTGTMRLASNWTPTQYDILVLVSDGTSWLEKSRGPSSLNMALAEANIFVGNASGVAAAVAVTGDVTISNAGVTAIGSGVIVNADVSGSAAIAYSKLAALPSAQVLVGSAGNVATAVAVTGDVTVSNTGVTAIASGVVAVADMSAPVMLEATGTLTQANLQAMNGAPVTLIAAGAAGTLHIVDEIELFHDYDTAAYTSGGDISIEYATSGTDISVVDVAWLQATADSTLILKPTACYSSSASTSAETNLQSSIAKAIQITNATGAFADGNAANIVKWRIRYHTVTAVA